MYAGVDAGCREVRSADALAEGFHGDEFEALRSVCREAQARSNDCNNRTVTEREWFNGRIFPSQGRDAGSIPVSRSKSFCLAKLRDVHTHRRPSGVRLVRLRTPTATSVRIRHAAESSFGDIAQLGERIHGMDEVRGSTPLISTRFLQ